MNGERWAVANIEIQKATESSNTGDTFEGDCGQCRLARLKCVRRSRYRFRVESATKYRFDPKQQWTESPADVRFLPLNSTEVLHQQESYESSPDPSATTPESEHAEERFTSQRQRDAQEHPLPYSPVLLRHGITVPPAYRTSPATNAPFSPTGCAPLQILDSDKAFLFRHYLENVASWFDFDDPSYLFKRHIIQKASDYDILLQAICALSSRQLSNFGRYDPQAAQAYHEMCMNNLISYLEPSSLIDRDYLFAATIILRTKEEFDTAWNGTDFEAHLLGIKSFTKSQWFDESPTQLRQRLYWIALRQEIHCALVKQRPLDINLSLSFTTLPFDLSCEDQWIQFCALNLGRIVDFAFDDEPKTRERWLSLHEATEELEMALPPSMLPYFESTVDDNGHELPFPRVWCVNNLAVFFTQYLVICRLLLTCLDSSGPRLGPGSHQASHKRNLKVIALLRRLCGLGKSNLNFGPSIILGCLGASIAGDRLQDEQHQEAVLEILTITEREHAWPTASIRQSLLDSWSIQ